MFYRVTRHRNSWSGACSDTLGAYCVAFKDFWPAFRWASCLADSQASYPVSLRHSVPSLLFDLMATLSTLVKYLGKSRTQSEYYLWPTYLVDGFTMLSYFTGKMSCQYICCHFNGPLWKIGAFPLLEGQPVSILGRPSTGFLVNVNSWNPGVPWSPWALEKNVLSLPCQWSCHCTEKNSSCVEPEGERACTCNSAA